MKKLIIIALCILALCFVVACSPQATTTTSTPDPEPSVEPDPEPELMPWELRPGDPVAPSTPPWEREPQELQPVRDLMENTIQITITMEDGGVIVADLYPDLAPQTVRNFVYLARLGFYDGLKFHRIISGFMVQGGCPLGAGWGSPGYAIWGEFTENGFVNEMRHIRGVLSMARADVNTAGSQFFIMHAVAPFLDNNYAAFGRVTSGLEVVDRIAETPNSGPDGAVAPENMPVIRSITVDSDVELPMPEKISR